MAILTSVVGLVLLIACLNVASLYLARTTSRQREIALRCAVGASRGRILRQLLVESVLLALVAGAVGLGIAYWSIALLRTIQMSSVMPIEINASLDARVLLFTLLLAVAAACSSPGARTSHAALEPLHCTAGSADSALGHSLARATAGLVRSGSDSLFRAHPGRHRFAATQPGQDRRDRSWMEPAPRTGRQHEPGIRPVRRGSDEAIPS